MELLPSSATTGKSRMDLAGGFASGSSSSAMDVQGLLTLNKPPPQKKGKQKCSGFWMDDTRITHTQP